MKERLLDEWHALRAAARELDRQTLFVLTMAALLVIVQYALGSRRFFRDELAGLFSAEWQGLMMWGWWFGMQ